MHPRPDGQSRSLLPEETGPGLALALGAAAISGLAIYLNAFAVRQLPDPAVYTTLKNGIAALVLVTAAIALGATRELRSLDRRTWLTVLLVGVVGGGVPFILFFTGLAQASAPGAAFIQKTLFVWVALLAVPLLGERLGLASLGGLAVLLLGQSLVLAPTGIRWGNGETLILVATLLWAVETVLVKRLLADVSPLLVAALRLGIGLIVLVGYVLVTNRAGVVASLGTSQWAWATATGLILAGYVATWFAALRRAPASAVTSVLVLGAVATGSLSTVTGGAQPSPSVVGGYVLMIAAAAVVGAVAVLSARVASRVAELATTARLQPPIISERAD